MFSSVFFLQEEELNGNMNLNHHHHHHHTLPAKKRNGTGSDKFEIPLPFGYHLDLDFLRFCTEELVSGETLERLQELRQQRRQQRKTLEALMGLKQKQREDKLKEIGPQKSIEVKRSFSPLFLSISFLFLAPFKYGNAFSN